MCGCQERIVLCALIACVCIAGGIGVDCHAMMSCFVTHVVPESGEWNSLEAAESELERLMSEARECKTDERFHLLEQALVFERDVILPLKRKSLSDNRELASLLFDNRLTRTSVRPTLVLFFAGEVLESLGEPIRAEWREEPGKATRLLLYCSLPSTATGDALEAVDRYERTSVSGDPDLREFCANIVKARFGDRQAGDAALQYLEKFTETDWCEMELMMVCAAYVRQEYFVRELAERLDSRETFTTLGFTFAKRVIYSFGIIHSRCNDSWFTLPPFGSPEREAVPLIERLVLWCDANIEGFSSEGMKPIVEFTPSMRASMLDGTVMMIQGRFIEEEEDVGVE